MIDSIAHMSFSTKTAPKEAAWDVVMAPEASSGRYGGLAYNGYQTRTAPAALPQTSTSYSSSQGGPMASQGGYRAYGKPAMPSQMPRAGSSQPLPPTNGFSKASSMVGAGAMKSNSAPVHQTNPRFSLVSNCSHL